MNVRPGEELTTLLKPPRLRRLGTRRLARAHVTLGERPQVAKLARQALGGVCETLGRELGCPVSASARLVEAVVMPATGLAQVGAFAIVDLSATGGAAVLELETPVLLAALERLAGSAQKPGPMMGLTRLEEAAFAFLGLSALCALRTQAELWRWLGPRLAGVTLNRSEALARLDARQRHVGVELTVTVGQTTAGGRLVLPAVVLEGAVKALPAERALAIAPEVLAARLATRCFMGRTPLSDQELRSLVVGDVVLFEGLRREGGGLLGPGRLATRCFELTGDFAPEGFSLNHAHRRAHSKESDMTSVTVIEEGDGMPPLPVDVEIELTRLLVPVSELAVLKPGALLPLHINASEPVLLRIGDRAVARAELVDIEGEVGARILTLLP
jgi:type III secretion protein Q